METIEQLLKIDMPIFEVMEVVPGGFGRKWRIWADGRTEGFECSHVVINCIKVMDDYHTAIAVEKAEQAFSLRHAIRRYLRDWVSRMAQLLGKKAKVSQ